MPSLTADHSKSRLTFTAAAPVSLAQSHGQAVEAMNSLDPVVAKTVAENAVGGVTIGVVVGPASYGPRAMVMQTSSDISARMRTLFTGLAPLQSSSPQSCSCNWWSREGFISQTQWRSIFQRSTESRALGRCSSDNAVPVSNTHSGTCERT